MKTELSIEIDRPLAEVFEFTTGHVTEWSLTCVEEEVLEEKPEGVGTTFRMVTQDRGQRMEFQGVVTLWEPPTAAVVHLTGRQFDIDVDYRFEDLSGRTRVTQRAEVRGKGIFKVLFAMLGWAMKRSGCKAQEDELANLKRLLEAREASVAG